MTKLIVVTSENFFLNEAYIINDLFKNRLILLHIRKPLSTIEKNRKLLQRVEKKYHKYIVIHQHYELMNEFNLGGIHIKEQFRKKLKDNLTSFIKTFQNRNKTVSSSFHSKQDILDYENIFDYFFLSPIFNSISKKGYYGKQFDVNDITSEIIALGGISETNILKAKQLGYSGIAVLGAVWNNDNPIEAFKRLQRTFE